MSHRVVYTGSAVRTLKSLSSTLSCDLPRLIHIASNVSDFYTSFSMTKRDGGERIIRAPKEELKGLQRRINSRILSLCVFPPYLQGSIRDTGNPRDFVTNASVHSQSKGFVCADIKSFFPSIRPQDVRKIYKYLFGFSDEVCDVLVSLTTLSGEVPQGAPTSSYIANLLFYDSEHKLVKEFERGKLIYTRLIDDITVSSAVALDKTRQDWIIRKINRLVSAKGLTLHRGKLKTATARTPGMQVYVTGLWVDQGRPRLASKVRNAIRSRVHICAERYKAGYAAAEDFHELYNSASGAVALMSRLGHVQAVEYREVLRQCRPEYDTKRAKKLTTLCYRFVARKGHGSDRTAYARRYHKLMYCLSILGRTKPEKASSLRSMLRKNPPKFRIKEMLED